MIGRRTFVLVLALGFVAGPRAAQAQPPAGKTARIGYLSFRAGPSHLEEAFRQGLRELGYIEGQNISIEYRWTDLKPDRTAALAGELVRLQVDVIVCTGGAEPALAAKRATGTIPIVFTAGDPLRAGLVMSLDRPEANVTGIHVLTGELNAKRLELLKSAVPGVSSVAVLTNPTARIAAGVMKDLEGAAKALRVTLHVVTARQPQEIDGAFALMGRERAGALLVVSDPMFFAQREQIVALVMKHRLPAIFEWREFVEAGGLMSYGTHLAEMYRRLATYVDKILKGARPGALPVEQPTRFELAINLKTAKALGLTIPKVVLDRADYVIPS